MRKTISILLVLATLLCFACPIRAAENAVSVSLKLDRQEASVGETVYLTLSADQTVTDLLAWQFNIGYDTTKFSMGTPQISADAWPSTVAGLSKGVGEGIFPVSALDVTGNAVALNAGEVATIPFTVKADAQLGETAFTITCDTLAAYDLTENREAVVLDNTATLTIVQAEIPEHYDGYAASLKPDVDSAIVGENLTAKVWISAKEETVTTYNAYDLTVTYDTEKLTFFSGETPDKNGSVTDNHGTVTILGYGADKSFDTAAVMLTFTAKETGEATINLDAAKVDLSSNASGNDVPPAQVQTSGGVMVLASYPVTLGEGLQAEKQVATAGEDFTFHAADFGNYDYQLPKAVTGETEIPVKDNGDGSYTISGETVTGPVSITVQRSPKSYEAKIEGSGKDDAKAAEKATYLTDYEITLNKQEGFSYTVTAVSGQKDVSLAEKETGTFVLPGTSITGPVVVTVAKTSAGENEVNVTKPAYVSGEAKAKKGTAYTFSITKEDGYQYGEPVVTIQGETVETTKKEDGSYTIPGDKITGDITITVSRESTTQVELTSYLTLNDGTVMWLVTVSGQIPEGRAALYGGNTMFWSEAYQAYAWLQISGGNKEDLLTQAKEAVTIGEGTAVALRYDGDVNLTGRTDINDAQLAYDLYKTNYSDFTTVSMEKFLRADVNGDKTITTQDAAAIVNGIRGS